MKAYCISDNADTVLGMRLAGIEGDVYHAKEEVLKKLTALENDSNIAIVFMTSPIVALCPDVVSDFKLNHTAPLLVEIPDRDNTQEIGKAIDTYMSEAIGIKL